MPLDVRLDPHEMGTSWGSLATPKGYPFGDGLAHSKGRYRSGPIAKFVPTSRSLADQPIADCPFDLGLTDNAALPVELLIATFGAESRMGILARLRQFHPAFRIAANLAGRSESV